MPNAPHEDKAQQAVAIAKRCLSSRFKGASFAYVAGSIIRGEGTAFSDIDLVVVFNRLDRAWRESFTEQGTPVEAFVHDPQTLHYFLRSDAERGYPLMPRMVATGRIVAALKKRQEAVEMQAKAAALLAAGPPPQSAEERSMLCYQITDLADDLRGTRPPQEVASIAAFLYPKLGDLILLGRGHWSGGGKWLPRMLRALDPVMAGELEAAMGAAAGGDGAALLALADRELALHGGRLFDGYKQLAPRHARDEEN